MANRRKNAQNCCFFGALFPLFSPSMFMNGFIKAAFILFGTRIVFGNTNCSRFVQKLMRHLMRQLMDINGETVLAGSASFLNPF